MVDETQVATAEAEAATAAPPEDPPVDPVLLDQARETLAKRYDERDMVDAAAYIRRGAWDKEPFMLALLDVLTQPAA